MSELRVSSIRSRKKGSVPSLPDGAVVTGVTTSTFSGDLTGDVTGNITGTAGTFSGDVSVGGAISYENVSDIDSVGVITARSGIKVGAGQSISPVSGTITYYGDGSGLTGVSAGSHNFVASGTIPNGSTVVINTDGTVGVVTETTSNTPSVGSAAVFESANTNDISATFDSSNNKVVIAYRDNDNSLYGTAVVGTVSGSSISFGTPVVFESASTYNISATFDSSNNKVVIAYRDNDNSLYGTAVVGTVSGTSISFGTPVVFNANNSSPGSAIFDSSNNKVVIAYSDSGNSNQGTAIVGTVSGTSISFGTSVVYESGSNDSTSATFDSSNNKVVIAYRDVGNSYYGTAVVGTVSNTSISFGTPVVFNSAGTTSDISATYDSTNNKVVISYRDGGNSNYGTALVGTVSGTSISFGTPVVFNSGYSSSNSAVFDSANGKVVISYRDVGNSSYGTAVAGTVSGTSISFGTPVVFESAEIQFVSATYDSANSKVVFGYRDNENSNYGTAVVFSSSTSTTNLTSENYIGIASEEITDGQTGKVTIVTGINEGQTGLTTGRTYYVQNDGSLGTSAGDPSVVAGTSISSTKIAVR